MPRAEDDDSLVTPVPSIVGADGRGVPTAWSHADRPRHRENSKAPKRLPEAADEGPSCRRRKLGNPGCPPKADEPDSLKCRVSPETVPSRLRLKFRHPSPLGRLRRSRTSGPPRARDEDPPILNRKNSGSSVSPEESEGTRVQGVPLCRSRPGEPVSCALQALKRPTPQRVLRQVVPCQSSSEWGRHEEAIDARVRCFFVRSGGERRSTRHLPRSKEPWGDKIMSEAQVPPGTQVLGRRPERISHGNWPSLRPSGDPS